MRFGFSVLAFILGLAIAQTGSAQTADEVSVDPATSSAAAGDIVNVFETPFQLSLSPGVVAFEGANGQDESRLVASAIISRNFSASGRVYTPVQYGLEGGLLYSHLGAPGSSFLGTGGTTGASASDGNLFVFPLHLWAGYYFGTSGILASLHTGADLFVRTNEASMNLGRQGNVNFFPAFGFRAGWDSGRNFAVSFQGNWSLVPTAAVFQGLLGVVIPIS